MSDPDPIRTSPWVGGNAAEDSAAPADPIGRYELGAEIARGGMGVVVRARDHNLNRELAVKLVHPHLCDRPAVLRRFREEAEVLGRLQHPGVVPVHEVGTLPDGRPFFAMKLVAGRTLADLLKERQWGDLQLGRFLPVFEQICQTVAFAHSRGYLHRDLKPANVMVGAFGEVQVMDWGLAKLVADPSPDPQDEVRVPDPPGDPHATADHPAGSTDEDRTTAGQAVGTPAYMPPEQARGETARVGPPADVFALGGILAEVLTGRPPLTGTRDEVLDAARSGRLDPAWERVRASGADPELIDLAVRCLQPDPADRPADAGALAKLVAAYRTGVEERLRKTELERVTAVTRADEQRKRRRVQLALVGSVSLLVLAGGAFAWWQDKQETAARTEEERRAAAAQAEEENRKVQTEREVVAALAEMGTLCERGAKETQNPPRWRLTLGAARSAHRRASAAIQAGPASDDLRGQFRAATARLERDEADCTTAELCERCFLAVFRAAAGERRESDSRAKSALRSLVDHLGIDLNASTPAAVVSRVHAHQLRHQLMLTLLIGAKTGSLGVEDSDEFQREFLRDAHPMKGAIRAAAAAGGLHNLLTEGEGRALASTELLCVVMSNLTEEPFTPAAVALNDRLLDEALARNPADFVALALRNASEARPTFTPIGGLIRKDWLVAPGPAQGVAITPADVRRITAGMNAVAVRPDVAAAWQFAAEELATDGLHAWAIDLYRRSVQIDPAQRSARLSLGKTLLAAGRFPEAVEVYRSAVKGFPRRASLGEQEVRLVAARGLLYAAHPPTGASRSSPEEREGLRREAMRWLRDWLTEYAPARSDLEVAQRAGEFDCVRDAAQLASLPPAEAARWQALWEEVRSTRGATEVRGFPQDGTFIPVGSLRPATPAPPPREVLRP